VDEEDTPTPDDLAGGYSQSKWVAERMAFAARDRGLPVSIYRLGTVSGDSRNGKSNPADFMNALMRVCLRIGAFPDVPLILDFAPVDFVARAIVHLSRGAPRDLGAFHICNPSGAGLKSAFHELIRLGHRLRLDSYDRWRRRALESMGNNDDLEQAFVSLLPADASGINDSITFDCTSTVASLGPVECASVVDLIGLYFPAPAEPAVADAG
jgi:thioester reductase-like protein